MSDETVRSALTADVWARLRQPYPSEWAGGRPYGYAVVVWALHMLDDAIAASFHRQPSADKIVAGSVATFRHGKALAAIALCPEFNGGQPFGFTHLDVARLRGLRLAFEPDDAANTWLPNLANRIAALLPPEGACASGTAPSHAGCCSLREKSSAPHTEKP